MDGQLYCESHTPTSPVSGPVSPTSPVVLNPGEDKKKVSPSLYDMLPLAAL